VYITSPTRHTGVLTNCFETQIAIYQAAPDSGASDGKLPGAWLEEAGSSLVVSSGGGGAGRVEGRWLGQGGAATRSVHA
jgi:hypothetical protein